MDLDQLRTQTRLGVVIFGLVLLAACGFGAGFYFHAVTCP